MTMRKKDLEEIRDNIKYMLNLTYLEVYTVGHSYMDHERRSTNKYVCT